MTQPYKMSEPDKMGQYAKSDIGQCAKSEMGQCAKSEMCECEKSELVRANAQGHDIWNGRKFKSEEVESERSKLGECTKRETGELIKLAKKYHHGQLGKAYGDDVTGKSDQQT